MTGNFTTTGTFRAGTNAGATAYLSPGSVEVKNSTGPYVDFATTDATDYTYRMQMTTSGELYFIHSSGNTVHFGTNGYVYAGSALLATGGDVNGTQWGGWLSSYLTTQLAAKASAGNTTVHSDGNNSINWNWESGYGVMRVDGSAQISLSPNVSDARLKVAIQPAASRDALCNIERIKFYSFNWKDTGVHEKFGYVAQQLKQIDPRYVHDGETLGFNDQTLLRDALRAIQQLSARVKELEGKQ